MKKVFKPLLALATVLACVNVSAAVMPMSDFEDATTQGWAKGDVAQLPVTVGVEDDGNHYLRYQSNGPDAEEHDKRIALIADKQWRGNYSAMGAQSITVRMKNMGPEDLQMHAAFGNSLAELRTRYATVGVAVAADGEWHDVAFSLTENLQQVSIGGHGKSSATFSAAEVLGNIINLRFTHGVFGETYLERRGPFEGYNAGEEVVADLWIDNISLSTEVAGDVSAVPLPGAVWLFSSAIIGLFVSRRKH
jgi:hypothetical protein